MGLVYLPYGTSLSRCPQEHYGKRRRPGRPDWHGYEGAIWPSDAIQDERRLPCHHHQETRLQGC